MNTLNDRYLAFVAMRCVLSTGKLINNVYLFLSSNSNTGTNEIHTYYVNKIKS